MRGVFTMLSPVRFIRSVRMLRRQRRRDARSTSSARPRREGRRLPSARPRAPSRSSKVSTSSRTSSVATFHPSSRHRFPSSPQRPCVLQPNPLRSGQGRRAPMRTTPPSPRTQHGVRALETGSGLLKVGGIKAGTVRAHEYESTDPSAAQFAVHVVVIRSPRFPPR